MEYNLKTIGKNIKRERKKVKLSQEEFGELLGIARGRVGKIESGEDKNFSISHLMRMSEIFGCDIGALLGEYESQSAAEEKLTELTGLSQSAVRVLRREKRGLFETQKKYRADYGAVVDKLLTEESGRQLLGHLSDYLFNDVKIKYKGAELSENLMLYNKTRKIEYPLKTLDIKTLLLSMIQRDIFNLDKEENI